MPGRICVGELTCHERDTFSKAETTFELDEMLTTVFLDLAVNGKY